MRQEKTKIVTVLANENIYNLKPFRKKCETKHKDTLIEFIYETGIEISNIDIYKTSSQELAFHLTKQGFIVVLETDERVQRETTVYLPKFFGKVQRKNLDIVISNLGESKLSVFELDSEAESLINSEVGSKDKESLLNLIREINVEKQDDETKQPKKLVRYM